MFAVRRYDDKYRSGTIFGLRANRTDKRFNLTCMFRGPGEAVVTSGYIGAGYARSYRSRDSVLHREYDL